MKSMLGSGSETEGEPKIVEGEVIGEFMLKMKERDGGGGGRHVKKYFIVEQSCTHMKGVDGGRIHRQSEKSDRCKSDRG